MFIATKLTDAQTAIQLSELLPDHNLIFGKYYRGTGPVPLLCSYSENDLSEEDRTYLTLSLNAEFFTDDSGKFSKDYLLPLDSFLRFWGYPE